MDAFPTNVNKGERNPLATAAIATRVLKFLEALRNMRGTDGIKCTVTDGSIVIAGTDLKNATQDTITLTYCDKSVTPAVSKTVAVYYKKGSESSPSGG